MKTDDSHYNAAESDALLQLRGSGTRLWASEHADEYVRRLRQNWEDLEKPLP